MPLLGTSHRPPEDVLPGSGPGRHWTGRAQWRILTTGFGQGQEFLAAWRAWRQDPARPGLLHIVSSCEQAPALQELATLPGEEALRRDLQARWWGLVPGVHRLVFEDGRVLLTLTVGPARRYLAEQDFSADSIVLDEEASQLEPADLRTLARCSAIGTTIEAPRLSAQMLDRLSRVGFFFTPDCDQPAAGRPVRGVFQPRWTRSARDAPSARAGDAVVIGAGLAGAAAAASLARRGWRVLVLDRAASPAAGASGLPAGLLAPHSTPDDNLLSRLTRSGVRITLQEAGTLLRAGLDWEPSGVLEERGARRSQVRDLGPGQEAWHAARAEGAALWHAAGAWIKPACLVAAWLDQPGVRWQGCTMVHTLRPERGGWRVLNADGDVLAQASLVVVAAAHASASLLPRPLALHAVRGQVTWGAADTAVALPPTPVNGNGHFLPRVPVNGQLAWLTGSTYVRGDTSTSLRKEEDAANLDRLQSLLPTVARQLAPAFAAGTVHSWAGVRCTASDRRPLVGQVEPGLWVSTAMGSRGLTFAALCGELLAARLHGEPLPLERRLADALSVERAWR